MSLKKIQGKVQKAGAYPLKAPKTVMFKGQEKTFTHRHSLQMDTGEWIGFGESHLDNFLVKDDEDNYQVLGAGSEVLIKYTENGDFKNAKKGNLVVLNLVKGERFNKGDQSQAPYQSNTGTTSANKGGNVNPAEVGQCLNLAAEVLKYSGDDLTNPDKVKVAIQWYKRTRQLFSTLYPVVDVEETIKETPKKEKKPEVEYDDDI